ncbi:MFS general substrate transporter [Auriscalpium vulgare]|uniref:MFS general substrate transporter n=1 Tax=Auriscalpium vulgare TaxID=40419 RepID=A0ACB8RX76_9AGAM|nr:MFS general substrate transporter [Auriscalpium vulgare]
MAAAPPQATPRTSTQGSPTVEKHTTPLVSGTPRRAALEDFENESDSRPPFILTRTELKLLGIAGVGFFLDAYDLFIINPVTTMLQYRLYGGQKLPSGLEGFVKAAANIGSVIGQFAFGFAADQFGRKAVYGKELMIIIFATIMCISDPTGDLSPSGALIWLGVFRIVLGIGVGGDYPMSASIASDRANLRKRGTMLAYIFANQGWGSLVGSLVTIITLAAYKNAMDKKGETSKVDGVWRIVIGVSLIPAFGTLYQRLRLQESTRFLNTRKLAPRTDVEGSVPTDALNKEKQNTASDVSEKPKPEKLSSDSENGTRLGAAGQPKKPRRAAFKDFLRYFSEWRHAKILIGTCACWFFLDIAFYGINLNQNVVLQQIGFAGTTGTPWERLWKVSVGNIIITALGFVPGYYVSVLTTEILGRKWIQIQGFIMAALFLSILAGKFHSLSKAGFVVCFAFLQFFFNFGANTMTYVSPTRSAVVGGGRDVDSWCECYPAEVFPTKYRATAHGVSAASGKAGAIISSLAFNSLSNKIGTPSVLWIFVGCCFAGAVFTLLLPEVKGRDPDLVLAEEQQEAESRRTL